MNVRGLPDWHESFGHCRGVTVLRPRPVLVFIIIFGQVYLKTRQCLDLKICNWFHRQAAEGEVNVTLFWWKHFIKLASLLYLSIYRMKRECVTANIATYAASWLDLDRESSSTGFKIALFHLEHYSGNLLSQPLHAFPFYGLSPVCFQYVTHDHS